MWKTTDHMGQKRDDVRERLIRAGVKPSVLARAFGVKPQLASMILKRKRRVSAWHYPAAAALLNVTVDDLYGLKSHTVGLESTPHTQPGESIAASSPSNPFSAATVQEMSDSITRLREISIELTRHADAMSRRLAAIAGHLSPYGADRDRADGPKSRKTSHR